MTKKTIYERLFDCWPDPRLLIERCEDGYFRVLTANEPACEYFTRSHETLNGRKLDDFLEAANKDHILQAFQVVCTTGTPLPVQVIPVFPDAIRIRSFILNPITDEEGRLMAIDMAARFVNKDETTLVRERDDAMSIFTTVFDSSDIGILVTDHNRRIVRVNAMFTQAFGWDPVDLIGREFTMLIPEGEHEIARRRHDDFEGNTFNERSRELRIIRKCGDLATVIATSGIIELTGGRKFRLSTLVDITQLKKIERDLRIAKELADTANQAKSSFLANMSHELRTPLNAIIGFSDLMIAGTLGPVENTHYREYLGDIKFSALHLLDIINDVLDMSKIEAGEMKLTAQPTDISSLVDEVIRLMRNRATEAGVMLKCEIPEGLPPIGIDQRMIRQVLLNLLSNAIKFSMGRGHVTVSLAQTPDFMLVSVADQGIGIPREKLEEVLKPFGQVQDPRINGGQGTGLGLPLAASMVELHGGKLNITSKPDQGTTVTFSLPWEGQR